MFDSELNHRTSALSNEWNELNDAQAQLDAVIVQISNLKADLDNYFKDSQEICTFYEDALANLVDIRDSIKFKIEEIFINTSTDEFEYYRRSGKLPKA